MKKVLLLLVVACTFVSARSFGDAGSMEAGGRFSLNTHIDDGESYGSVFSGQPIFNWFFRDNIYLAGKLHFSFADGGSFWGIGAGAGYLFTPESAAVMPYVDGGLEMIYSSWSESIGMAIPVNAGIKIPLYPHVALDVGGYVYTTIIDDNASADLGFAGGVTVLIF